MAKKKRTHGKCTGGMKIVYSKRLRKKVRRCRKFAKKRS